MNHNHIIGYATLALKNLGYSRDEIWKVVHEMHGLFDFQSEEDAAKQAETFLKDDN
ncbi:RuvA C-terminal domain-containing protein [Desmospora profundinema]|uniref:Holliday junction resolvasome RuvABC DNA-binding subunit n=1 Tax=Desmospora profundinema TaxID=1571184 RepID=A0ABU1ILS0_9BACL|nr:RuvA C-terminal domain-containing protein [Desmospora profundinema]MDR6225718.1 Holliday junction resolvasome RuvABC DNA-binding subunit [Desmospora profundinema]